MTNSPVVYYATIHRPREVWRDFVVSCQGFRVEYTPGAEDGVVTLAQKLVAAGKPDGELHIAEIGVKKRHGLMQIRPSIVALSQCEAVHPVRPAEPKTDAPTDETGISQVQREALALCPMSVEDWHSEVHHLCRRALVKRGWVFLHEDGMVHALEESAILAGETAPNSEIPDLGGEKLPPSVNPKILEILTKIKEGSMGRVSWKNLHGKTKGNLERKGWVTVSNSTGKPVLTEAGLALFKM